MKIYKEKKNRYSKLRVNGLGNYMDRPLMLFFCGFLRFSENWDRTYWGHFQTDLYSRYFENERSQFSLCK